MRDVKNIADLADLIVNGYAFTKCEEGFQVLNINNANRATLLSKSGKVLATTMDDIENKIVINYFMKNKRFMEE